MKTSHVLPYVFLALVGGAAPLMGAAPPPVTSQPQAQLPVDVLKQTVREIVADKQPLPKVLNYLADTMGMHLTTHADMLEQRVLTINMKDATLEAMLDAALADTGCSYEVEGKNIYVFDAKHPPAARIHLEVYPINDLANNTDADDLTQLIDTIKASVSPDSWFDNGGTVGSIKSFKGTLVINQTTRTQRDVAMLLNKLREHKKDLASSPTAQANQMQAKVQIVGNLKETSADPEAMGIIAISELHGISKKPAELVLFLLNHLDHTKSLSLRNAIRLTLKDIFLETGDTAAAQKQLEAILTENDVTK